MRQNPCFSLFDSWGEGYYAVSVGVNEMEACRRYIINQEEHHKVNDMLTEVADIAEANGLAWYEEDWT